MTKKYYAIMVSLFVSLFIYLFYRTDKTVINEMAILLFSRQTYLGLKTNIVTFLPLNDIVIYSLPEGLWIFCATITSRPYFIRLGKWKFKCAYIPLIYGVGLEILQLYHITNGRFDYTDLWVSAIFWLIGINAYKEEADRQNRMMPLNLQSVACLATYGIVYLSHVFK